jgi:hypothetical protein
LANFIDYFNGDIDWYYIISNGFSSVSVVDHTTPNGTSAIIAEDDGAGADYFNIFTNPVDEVRASNYDTTVAQIPVKSLWNYNVLPYTRNISEGRPDYYNIAGSLLADEKGPDGVSEVWEILASGWNKFFSMGPGHTLSSMLHSWDENLIKTFSISVKKSDDYDEFMRLSFTSFDETDPDSNLQSFAEWNEGEPHPIPTYQNEPNRAFTVKDEGDGWYRISFSVYGLLDNSNCKNGDVRSLSLRFAGTGGIFKLSRPQVEFHTITDTNLLKPSWEWFAAEYLSYNGDGWILRDVSDNVIELREDPFGLSSLCWVTQDNDVDAGFEGGFDSPIVNIDSSSTYRYSIWARQNTPFAGSPHILYGPGGGFIQQSDRVLRNLDGSMANNPYFADEWLDLPSYDEWYLLVGHVQAEGVTLPATTLPETGIYDVSGNKLSSSFKDFVFSSTNTVNFLRAFQYSNPANGQGDEIVYWSPRIEKVDGTEPSISELLASGNLWTNPNYQQTLPSPYVENVGVHPNPHRHNWLKYTDTDLVSQSTLPARPVVFIQNPVTVEASTVGTTYANGETCSYIPSSSSRIYYQTNNSDEPAVWNDDDTLIFSYYVKYDPSNSTGNAVQITMRDTWDSFTTLGSNSLSFDPSGGVSSITSNTTEYTALPFGYESVADGWYRIWYGATPNYSSTISEGDRITIDIGGAGTSFWMMRPMLEKVGANTTITTPPRSYQAVQGEWDLGVTSIPEHKCAQQVALALYDSQPPGANYFVRYEFSGGLLGVESGNYNQSVEYLGDGWYNAIVSTSGLASANTKEGDKMYVAAYPTGFTAQLNNSTYGMFAQPFLGLTGDLNTSSVDYNP